MGSNAVETVTMDARVLRGCACNGELLVRDRETDQEVRVRTAHAGRFRAGEDICIRYNGIMTMSIPPQINADRICRGRCS